MTEIIWGEEILKQTTSTVREVSAELQYRRKLLLRIGEKFNLNSPANVVLKTDAWNEAIRADDIVHELMKCNFSCFSVDIAEDVVRAARKNYDGVSNVEFDVGDLTSLAYESNTFDSVYSPSTLDHMPPEQAQKALNELHRVLKVGGKAEITFDNALCLWMYSLFFRLFLSNVSKRSWYPVTKWECVRMLRRSDFRIVSADAILLYPTVGGVLRLERSPLRRAISLLLRVSKAVEDRSSFLNPLKAESVFIVEKVK